MKEVVFIFMGMCERFFIKLVLGYLLIIFENVLKLVEE